MGKTRRKNTEETEVKTTAKKKAVVEPTQNDIANNIATETINRFSSLIEGFFYYGIVNSNEFAGYETAIWKAAADIPVAVKNAGIDEDMNGDIFLQALVGITAIIGTAEASALLKEGISKVNARLAEENKEPLFPLSTMENEDLVFIPSIRGENILVIAAYVANDAKATAWIDREEILTTVEKPVTTETEVVTEEEASVIEEVVNNAKNKMPNIVDQAIEIFNDMKEKIAEIENEDIVKETEKEVTNFNNKVEDTVKKAEKELKSKTSKVKNTESDWGKLALIAGAGVLVVVGGKLAYDYFSNDNTVDFNIL